MHGRTRLAALLLGLVAGLLVVPPGAAVPRGSTPAGPAQVPVLRVASPSSGTAAGGTSVRITGRHLRGVSRVTFGGVASPSVKQAGKNAVVAVAPAHARGRVEIKVTTARGVARGLRFTYQPIVAPPEVTGFLAGVGPVGAGIVVQGHGFDGVSRVTFDGVPATLRAATPTSVTVTAPEHPVGPAQVLVTTAKGGTSQPTAASTFTYIASTPGGQPGGGSVGLFQVYPGRGPDSGGTRVGIEGTGFAGVTAVTFGGVPGTDIHVLDSFHLEVTTPAHAFGMADVRVVTSLGVGVSTADENRFHFLPPRATITAVSPAQATLAGARLTVTGTHFEEVEEVDLYEWEPGLDLVVLSPTTLQVTAPPSQVGATAHLDVITSAGSSVPSAADAFTWVAPPRVSLSDSTHAFGPTSGGTRVELDGTGFTGLGGVTGVDFGGTPALDVVVDSDTRMHVTSPPHAAGYVDVHVTTPAGTSKSHWADRFSYEGVVTPAGTSVTPAPAPHGATWSTVDGVACPAAGRCVAVGTYELGGTGHALVERLADGSWTYTALPLPPDASTAYQDAFLSQVACPEVDFCVAVGGYDRSRMQSAPLLATWDGLAWTVDTVPLPEAFNGDDWVTFNDLDCTAALDCAAVGTTDGGYTDIVVTYSAGSWAVVPSPVPTDHDGALNGVDCTATECVAVGVLVDDDFHSTPLVERGSGSSWTAQSLAFPAAGGHGGSLEAVSCASEGACVAVGGYWTVHDYLPLSETLEAGTWTPRAVPQPATPDLHGYAGLSDVSCPSSDQCVAVGSYEVDLVDGFDETIAGLPMYSFLGASPVHSEQVPTPNSDSVRPDAGLQELVCTAPGTCVGTGGYDLATHRSRTLVGSATGGQVSGTQLRTPDPDGESFVQAVAADSAASAVAVGYYVDELGHWRGYLTTGVPIG